MNPNEIRSIFDKLKEATTKPKEVKELCEKYLSENTPSYEFSIIGATIDPYNLIPHLKDREEGIHIIEQLAKSLTEMLEEMGYRNNIETQQEHSLCGSSGSGLNPNANDFPYTVGAVLNGIISVEEARRARKLEYIKRGAIGKYWGIDGFYCILLPEIDDNGLTVKDPVLVDRKGNVIAEKLVAGAHYKRG